MRRVPIARVVVVAAGLGLVGIGAVLVKFDSTRIPLSKNLATPTPHPSELAVFQEIIKARREAGIGRPQTGGRGVSTTPGGSHKGAAKMEREARRRAAKLTANIALAHGMTPEDVESIYRRGRAEGWPARTTR